MISFDWTGYEISENVSYCVMVDDVVVWPSDLSKSPTKEDALIASNLIEGSVVERVMEFIKK